MQVLLRNRIIS